MFFLPRRKDPNTALITTSIGFICVPTATAKTLAYTVPVWRDEQQWEELIPPRENIMLEGFTLFMTGWSLKSVSAG
ncbi:hypothetical protein ACLK1T_25245 [Escherichia coli]